VRNGSLRKKCVYLGCFTLHFTLILLVSGRQALSVLPLLEAPSPPFCSVAAQRLRVIAAAVMGEQMPPSNGWRQGIAAYTHSAGIATGYGFFAPHVPSSHKLVFEVKYADGRVEYELPRVGGSATGVRLPLLFDNIAFTGYSDFRETMLRMMAYSIWREHRDAIVIRAVFGLVEVPGIADFERGKRESYESLFAYDFTFSPSDGAPKP
jgi:hypothetical protein